MEQLLATKLYIPHTRPELVRRPDLIERLNDGLQRWLTLISAPAGLGKTTLASEWLGIMRKGAQKESQFVNSAWLSLDDGDNDLARFLTYFITALNRAAGMEGTIGEGALGMLQSPQPPTAEVVLTSLINEIAALPGKIVLVLDDFHSIESSQVDDALTFLLDHIPAQFHVVIATREDPNLPLTRRRAARSVRPWRAGGSEAGWDLHAWR